MHSFKNNKYIHYIFIISITFISYYPSLSGDFVFDDIPAIVNNPDVTNGWTSSPNTTWSPDQWMRSGPVTTKNDQWTVTNFWTSIVSIVSRTKTMEWSSRNFWTSIVSTTDLRSIMSNLMNIFCHDFWGQNLSNGLSHKSYRPITIISFKINYSLSGLNPYWFHFTNLILHSIVSILFYELTKLFLVRGSSSSLTSLLTSLLFTLHPIHTDAVSSIVGRSEILSAIFFITSLISYLTLSSSMAPKISPTPKLAPLGSNGKTRKRQLKKSADAKSADSKSADAIKRRSFWMPLMAPIILSWIGFLCKEQCLMVLIVCLAYEGLCYHYNRCLSGRIGKLSKKLLSNMNSKRAPSTDAEFWIKLSQNNNNYKTFPNEKMVPTEETLNCSYVYAKKMIKLSKAPKIEIKPDATLRYDAKGSVSRMVALLFAFLAPLLVRTLTTPGSIVPTFNKLDNPVATSGDRLSKILTYSYLSVYNFYLLIFPSNLSCDWTHNSLPIIDAIWRFENLAPIIFYSSLIGFLVQINAKILSAKSIIGPSQFLYLPSFQALISIGIIVITFLPASNLFFHVGFVIAERILYLPSIGSTLMVGLGFDLIQSKMALKVRRRIEPKLAPSMASSSRTPSGSSNSSSASATATPSSSPVPSADNRSLRKKKLKKMWKWSLKMILFGFMVLILVSFGAKTFIRCYDWRSEKELFLSGLKVNPENVKLLNNMGRILEVEEEERLSRNRYSKNEPNGALLNESKRERRVSDQLLLGKNGRKVTKYLERTETSEIVNETLDILNETNESYPELFSRRTIVESNYTESIDFYMRALEIENKSLRTYLNIGNLYLKMNKFNETEHFYRRAVQVVQEEYFDEKRTSKLHVTALLRFFHLLSRDHQKQKEAQKVHDLAVLISTTIKNQGSISAQDLIRARL